MAIIVWVVGAVAIFLLFTWMWKFASKIERKALEEKRWMDHIKQTAQYDKVEAARLWKEFERKFL